MNSLFDDISIITNSIDKIKNQNNNIISEKENNFYKSLEFSDISKNEQLNEKAKEIIYKNDNNTNINNLGLNNPLNSFSKLIKLSSNKSYNNTKNKNNNKNTRFKRFRKEDLDNIPLPIFSCIYCSNDYIAFKHLSNEIISNKYLFQTSIFDLKQLNFLISYKPNNIKFIKNNKLLNIYINYSEYLKKFYKIAEINNYFNINIFKLKCLKNNKIINNTFRQLSKKYLTKDINKILKKSNNNSFLFNPNNIRNNYKNNYNKLNADIRNKKLPVGKILSPKVKRNLYSLNRYNSSLFKLNSNSNSKYEISFFGKDRSNNLDKKKKINYKFFEYENIKAKNTKIFDISGIPDLKRKINKKDIEWENNFYDIYNPIIDDDIFNKKDLVKSYNKNLNIKIDKGNNITYKYKPINEQIYIHSENNIFKYLENKKLSFFNNNKSFGSTNTSSNMNIKNMSRDKANNSFSLLLNKDLLKLSNISAINKSNFYVDMQNKITSSKSTKNENKIYGYNQTPSYSKKKLKDLYSKSEKKLIKDEEKKLIEYKNNDKKILFNYISNIKKENNYNFVLKDIIHNSKRNNLNISGNLSNISNHNQMFKKNNSNIILNTENWKKSNILLTKNNYNFKNNFFNKSLFNKYINSAHSKENEIKYNNFSENLKIKKNFENSLYKNNNHNSFYKNNILSQINNHMNIERSENEKNNKKNKLLNLKDFYKNVNKYKSNYPQHKSTHKEKFLIPKIFPKNIIENYKRNKEHILNNLKNKIKNEE